MVSETLGLSIPARGEMLWAGFGRGALGTRSPSILGKGCGAIRGKGFLVAACLVAILPGWPRAAGAQGWIRHEDPNGFVVDHPPGWTVQYGRVPTPASARSVTLLDGVMLTSAWGDAHVTIAPFTSSRRLSAEEVVRELTGEGERVEGIRRLGNRGGEMVVATSVLEASGGTVRSDALCLSHGFRGEIYQIAAGADTFQSVRATMIRMLGSFRYTRASSAAPGPPQIRYDVWWEPNQRAFMIAYPAGWSMSGGLATVGLGELRGGVKASSPDGQIQIGFGDPTLGPFVLPSSVVQEGQLYPGSMTPCMRYLPGFQFVKWHVGTRISQFVSRCTVVNQCDRQDIAGACRAVAAMFPVPFLFQDMHAGEVEFTGVVGNTPVRGYEFAITERRILPGNMGGWSAPILCGFVAAQGREAEASSVMIHMIQSCQWNPQWIAQSTETAGIVSKILTESNRAISEIITRGYEGRQSILDRLGERRSQATLGQTEVLDPDTNQRWVVEGGHNYYWARPHGSANEVVGTESYERPDIDFVPLTEQ